MSDPMSNTRRDIFGRRGADGLPRAEGTADVEHAREIDTEQSRKLLQIGKRYLIERRAPVSSDNLSDNLVRVTKRHPFLDEIFGQISGEKIWIARGRIHTLGIEFQFWQQRGKDLKRGPNSIDRIKERFLVFLKIAIVGGWQSFQCG